MKALFCIVILFCATLICFAQDNQNEFQRIATRTMNTHDNMDVSFTNDSIAYSFHGGAYMGVSSQGRSMPSGYFTYKRNKYVITGNLSADILEGSQTKKEWTEYETLRTQTINDIHNKNNKIDGSVRLDYYLRPEDCFTVGMLENYSYSKTIEDALTTHYDLDGKLITNEIKNQDTKINKLKLGWLMQWKHLFGDKSLLMTRANLRYHKGKTDVDQTRWDKNNTPTISNAFEKSKDFNPYGQIQYTSANWSGFNFVVSNKFIYYNTNIDEQLTSFRYFTNHDITDLKLNYKNKILSMYVDGWHEYFHRNIDGEAKTTNDWLIKSGLNFNLSKSQTISVDYNSFVTRPIYSQLYYHRYIGSSIGTYYIGNKDLGPSKTQQIGFAYNVDLKQLSVKTGFMYELIRDDITKISGVDDDGSSYKTWVNDATYRNINLTMDGKWICGPLDLRWHVRAKRINYGTRFNKDDKAWSWNFKIRPEVTLGAGWKVAAALYYIGKESHTTYYNRPYTYVSVRGYKDFGRWSIYAFIQDIFENDRSEVTRNINSRVVTDTDQNSRSLIIGCSYTF